jgi:hypothetical protein
MRLKAAGMNGYLMFLTSLVSISSEPSLAEIEPLESLLVQHSE